MYIMTGHVEVKAEMRDETVQECLKLATVSRQEPGCRFYAFYADLENSNRIHVYEEWESRKALEAHFETPHVRAFFTVLSRVSAAPAELKEYVVESVELP